MNTAFHFKRVVKFKSDNFSGIQIRYQRKICETASNPNVSNIGNKDQIRFASAGIKLLIKLGYLKKGDLN